MVFNVDDDLLRVFIIFTKAIYYFIDNFARKILFEQLTPEEFGVL